MFVLVLLMIVPVALVLAVFLAFLLVNAIKTLVSGNYHAVIVGLGTLGGMAILAIVGWALSARLMMAHPLVGSTGYFDDVSIATPTLLPARPSSAISHALTTVVMDDEPAAAESSEQTPSDSPAKPAQPVPQPAPPAEQPPPAPESAAPAIPIVEQPTPRPVEPLATPIVTEPVRITPASRPRWVDSEPVLIGDVQQRPVSSGPYEKLRDCRRALDVQLRKAVDEYVDEYFDEAYGERLKASQIVHYDANWIKSHLVGPDGIYQETVQVSFGPMQQIHALVVFDAEFRQELDGRRPDLDRQCRALVATSRLLVTALGFGFLLSVLGVVYGYFRLDAATHVSHSRRLQFLGGAAILALLVVVLRLARQITWM